MQTVEDEGNRVLKKQRICVSQIDRHLDELLTHVERTKQQLEERQKELCRKKNRQSSNAIVKGTEEYQEVKNYGLRQVFDSVGSELPSNSEKSEVESKDVEAKKQDNEVGFIIKNFIKRAQHLKVEKNIGSELKAMHVLLSKYSKHIDKVNGVIITLRRGLRLIGACVFGCRIFVQILPRCVAQMRSTRNLSVVL